jgi:hypothetical protein
MNVLSKNQVYRYINKSYPRLDYNCDKDFKLFDFKELKIDPDERKLWVKVWIKDQKAYSIFPPMELIHGILISNMLIICFGEHTGEYVSALIKNLDVTANTPVFVDKPFIVEMKFFKPQKRHMNCEARFNDSCFIIKTELFIFNESGKLEDFVLRRRSREERNA